MAKRQSDLYLTHDNWDEETNEEERGEILVADKDTIQQRVFKVAKRRINEAKPSTTAPNLFASFSFGANSSSSAASAFINNSSTTSKDLQPVKNQENVPINGHKNDDSSVFNSFNPVSSLKSNQVINLNSGSSWKPDLFKDELTISQSLVAAPLQSNSSSMTSSTSTSLTNSSSSRSDCNLSSSGCLIYNGPETDYDKKMRKLNESVYKWITQHLKSAPHCILTPIFDDYNRYILKIDEEFAVLKSDLGKSSSTKTHKKNIYEPRYNFGSSESFINFPQTKNIIESNNQTGFKPNTNWMPSKDKVSFGQIVENSEPNVSEQQESTLNPEKLFNSNPLPNLNTDKSESLPFSFGSSLIPLQPTTVSAGFFKPTGTSMLLFAQNSDATSVQKIKNEQNDDQDETEDPEELKKMQTPQPLTHETNFYYSIKCKLYYLKDKSYKEKGCGTLYLKKLDNSKTQLIIRADNVNGSVILNILLTNHIPVTRP